MVLTTTFNATFRRGNILQILKLMKDLELCKVRPYALLGIRRNFDYDEHCNNVAIKIVSCNKPLPTVAATELREKLSHVTRVNNRHKKPALTICSCNITLMSKRV